MFLLRLLRYVRGYVRFTAEGVFIERFLNLLARDRIPVWDSRKRGDRYTGCVGAGNYRKLRAHAKKAGVRIRLGDKLGAPFQRRRFRHRKGLLVGLGVFVLFLYAMSLFIWRVEVGGLETVSEQRVLEVLDTLGIRSGTLRMKIDVRDAERRALIELPELSWIALNIDGSALDVEVYETVLPPANMVDPHQPCNVVAAASGQIISMNVYEGQQMIMKGDTVLEGDVIVSGITQDRLGQNLFRHARAEVVAEVRHTAEVRVELDAVEYVETGEEVRRSILEIGPLHIPLFLPLGIDFPYHVEREEYPLRVLSLELPVSRHSERYVLMREVPLRRTEEEAKNLALRELELLEQAQLADAVIVDRVLSGRLEGDSYLLTARYILHMNIAREQEILLPSE